MTLTEPHIIPLDSGVVKSRPVSQKSQASKKTYESLKKGIWVYFLLLIFEGALRKWVLPGLSNPLLVVRDPVALWLVIKGWQKGMIQTSIMLNLMVAIGVVGTITTLVFGHGDLVVDLFGARLLLLHFPLIFVIAKVFTREDVVQLGRVLLWMAVPMTILMGLQFYSPQSAWVNRGVGGDLAGAGFLGAANFFRPPTTFSFITGTVFFYSMIGCYVIYFWLNPTEKVNRVLLLAATVCLVASIPLSISRSLGGTVAITVAFVVLASARNPGNLLKVAFIGVLVFMLFLVLGNYSFFKVATDAFTTRIDNANGSEGGIAGTSTRFFNGFFGALYTTGDTPLFGYGLGLGSNAGAQLLSGKRGFTISEDEWGRIVGELGFFLGIPVILIRISMVIQLFKIAYKKVVRNDILSWLLLSIGFLTLLNGQWAQPTTEGFATVLGGLAFAAAKNGPSLNVAVVKASK